MIGLVVLQPRVDRTSRLRLKKRAGGRNSALFSNVRREKPESLARAARLGLDWEAPGGYL